MKIVSAIFQVCFVNPTFKNSFLYPYNFEHFGFKL